MNELWAVVLTRNNLALSRAAIDSLRNQVDVGKVNVLVVDNGSTDDTVRYLASQPDLFTILNVPSNSVAGAWNQALKWIFYSRKAELAVVCNNDIIARPDALKWLIADGGGFVTCVGSNDPEKIKPTRDNTGYDYYLEPDPSKKRPHPDFSFYLIRKWVYEKVGKFDERYLGAFGEDADMHLRMHRAGVKAEALELPFYHYGSATVKLCDGKERKRIQVQADKNRALFKEMYGFSLGSPEYYASFGHTEPTSSS